MILTLPGESERQVMLFAHRDSPEGPGYASSAAATATLVEAAESFGGSRHSKTLVFVSTSGGSDGASGARAFVEDYPERELIDGAIVVEQPGASRPSPPHVLPWSVDARSTSIQLDAVRLRGRRRADRLRAAAGGALRQPDATRGAERPR